MYLLFLFIYFLDFHCFIFLLFKDLLSNQNFFPISAYQKSLKYYEIRGRSKKSVQVEFIRALQRFENDEN